MTLEAHSKKLTRILIKSKVTSRDNNNYLTTNFNTVIMYSNKEYKLKALGTQNQIRLNFCSCNISSSLHMFAFK